MEANCDVHVATEDRFVRRFFSKRTHARERCAWPGCHNEAVRECEFDEVTRIVTRPICEIDHTYLVG